MTGARTPAGAGYYAFLAVMSALCLAPVVLMLATSLKLKTQIFSDELSFFFTPTVAHYSEVLAQEGLRRNFANSLITATASTFFTLTAGCMAAYALARFSFIGRGAVSGVTLLMRMAPPAVLVVPVFMLWTYRLEISDTLPGLILAYTAINLPFAIWILQGFFAQIPTQLEEAARMDGANPFQAFMHVVLPLIKPGLAATAIFSFRIAWNEFIMALVLTNRFTRTIPVEISLSVSEHNIEWGKIMAIGTLIAIPPLIFTFAAARQIVTGLTAGAVKG